MKNKIILSIGTFTILTSSVYANMEEKVFELPGGLMVKKFAMNEIPMKDRQMKQRRMGPHMRKDDMILSKIMMLDLNKDQMKSIRKILEEKNKNIIDPLDAFSDSSFNKNKFLKAIEENKEERLKDKVEKIAKIYALLTKQQKKDLKTILDMDKIMKRKLTHKKPPRELCKQEFRQ